MKKALFIVPHFFRSPQETFEFQNLVQSVAECNFQVRVLTTWEEGQEVNFIHKNVEILQPFQKWNIFEIGAILRVVQGFSPDLVHFIYSPGTLRARGVPLTLPGVVQSFGSPRFVLQVQGKTPENDSMVLKYWLQLSQAVLVDDDFTKLKMSSMQESQKHQMFHVLKRSGGSVPQNSDSHWAKSCFDQFIYSVGAIRSTAQLEDCLQTVSPYLVANPSHGLVCVLHSDLSSYVQTLEIKKILKKYKFTKQVVVLKSVDSESNHQLINSCSLVSLTHLPIGSKEIPTSLKMAQEAGKPVLVQQALLNFEKSLASLLSRAVFPKDLLSRNWNSPPPSQAPAHETMDNLGNQLSRIYQDILSQRTFS